MASKNARLTVLISSLLILSSGASGASETSPVRSLSEARNHNVVIQHWDLSCGAAALATVLNFQHGDFVSEREIATRLMSRTEYIRNPIIVRIRRGFSLLDLKRFVENRGYEGVGLGRLRLEHLIDRAPVIVPINSFGYQHFVVFRGMSRDRVLLADPAFGNRTMLRSEFENSWIRFDEIGRVGFVVERRDGLIPPNRLEPHPTEFLTFN